MRYEPRCEQPRLYCTIINELLGLTVHESFIFGGDSIFLEISRKFFNITNFDIRILLTGVRVERPRKKRPQEIIPEITIT